MLEGSFNWCLFGEGFHMEEAVEVLEKWEVCRRKVWWISWLRENFVPQRFQVLNSLEQHEDENCHGAGLAHDSHSLSMDVPWSPTKQNNSVYPDQKTCIIIFRCHLIWWSRTAYFTPQRWTFAVLVERLLIQIKYTKQKQPYDHTQLFKSSSLDLCRAWVLKTTVHWYPTEFSGRFIVGRIIPWCQFLHRDQSVKFTD